MTQKTVGTDVAIEAIIKTILAARITGLQREEEVAVHYGTDLTVCWERAWTVAAMLCVSWDVFAMTDGVAVGHMKFSVNCPTVERSPAQAIAASVLFREVAELACLLEAAWCSTVVTLAS